MGRIVRRALILSCIGAGALMLGLQLGRFTMAGVTSIDRPMNEMQQLQAFARTRQAERDARTLKPRRVAGPDYSIPEAHVCEGCDANRYRDKAMAMYFATPPAGDDAPAVAQARPAEEDAQPAQ